MSRLTNILPNTEPSLTSAKPATPNVIIARLVLAIEKGDTERREEKRREEKRREEQTFIDIGLFERILIHLKKQGFIGKYADLDLYNKGEPFLHPNFEEIINITTRHGIFVNLSTNASVLPKVSEKFNAASIR